MSGDRSTSPESALAFIIDTRNYQLVCKQLLQKDQRQSQWSGNRQPDDNNDPTMVIRGIMKQVRSKGEKLGLCYITVDPHVLTLKFEDNVTNASTMARWLLGYAVRYAAARLKKNVSVTFV